MKRLYVNPAKTAEMYKVAVVKKCYVHEIAAMNLSKIYFLKNAKKICKPKNRDWIMSIFFSDDMGLVKACLNNTDGDDPEIIALFREPAILGCS